MTRCPLCGYEYEPNLSAGCAGCPLAGACSVSCCPRCGYRLPAESHLGKLLKRIAKRGVANGHSAIADRR